MFQVINLVYLAVQTFFACFVISHLIRQPSKEQVHTATGSTYIPNYARFLTTFMLQLQYDDIFKCTNNAHEKVKFTSRIMLSQLSMQLFHFLAFWGFFCSSPQG